MNLTVDMKPSSFSQGLSMIGHFDENILPVGIDRTEHITNCTTFVEGSPSRHHILRVACGYFPREHLEHDDLRG
jgi:hypothetical protein